MASVHRPQPPDPGPTRTAPAPPPPAAPPHRGCVRRHHFGELADAGLVRVTVAEITRSDIATALNMREIRTCDPEQHFTFARPLELLAAPDIRAADFEDMVLPAVASGHTVTNQVTSNDEALRFSKKINAGPRRNSCPGGEQDAREPTLVGISSRPVAHLPPRQEHLGTCIERSLDRRALVWAVLALTFGLLAWGELRATNLHTSPAFVVGYLWIELQVMPVLLVAYGGRPSSLTAGRFSAPKQRWDNSRERKALSGDVPSGSGGCGAVRGVT